MEDGVFTTRNQYRGRLPKKGWGAWTVCRFKERLSKKERVLFLRGVDTPINTMVFQNILFILRHWKKQTTLVTVNILQDIIFVEALKQFISQRLVLQPSVTF